MSHSLYKPELMGHATVEPTGAFPAGSFQSFILTYTSGYFGIDDTGTIKVVHRFAAKMRGDAVVPLVAGLGGVGDQIEQ